MRINSLSLRRLPFVAIAAALIFSVPAAADDWPVYLGGGLEPIEGGWSQRRWSSAYPPGREHRSATTHVDVTGTRSSDVGSTPTASTNSIPHPFFR